MKSESVPGRAKSCFHLASSSHSTLQLPERLRPKTCKACVKCSRLACLKEKVQMPVETPEFTEFVVYVVSRSFLKNA